MRFTRYLVLIASLTAIFAAAALPVTSPGRTRVARKIAELVNVEDFPNYAFIAFVTHSINGRKTHYSYRIWPYGCAITTKNKYDKLSVYAIPMEYFRKAGESGLKVKDGELIDPNAYKSDIEVDCSRDLVPAGDDTSPYVKTETRYKILGIKNNRLLLEKDQVFEWGAPGTPPAPRKVQAVYYKLPPDFTAFKSIASIEIKASTNCAAGRFIADNWNAAEAEKILGEAQEGSRRGISFETTSNGKKIFILFFNADYPFDVLDGISMKQTKQDILRKLGAPQFEDKQLKLFGYKGKRCYVFFTGDDRIQGVTVYRRDTDHDKDFIRRSANGDAHVAGPTSDKHYSAGTQTDYYISAGVKCTSDMASYYTIYNNFEGEIADGVRLPEDYAKVQEIVRTTGDKDATRYHDDVCNCFNLVPGTDLVFSYECERQNQVAASIEEGVLSPDGKKSLVYDGCSGGNANITIRYRDGFHPEIKQYTGFISTYAWINDRYVVYCGVEDRSPIMFFDSVSRKEYPINGKEYEEATVYDVLSAGNDKVVYTVRTEPGHSWDYPSHEDYKKAFEATEEKYEQLLSYDASGKIIFGERHKLPK